MSKPGRRICGRCHRHGETRYDAKEGLRLCVGGCKYECCGEPIRTEVFDHCFGCPKATGTVVMGAK